jgi:type I restriction enzyme M protein
LEALEGRLIPPDLIIQEFFAKEQKAIEELETKAETLNAQMEELRDEHGGEDGLLANAIDDKGKISKNTLTKALKEAQADQNVKTRQALSPPENQEEYDMLMQYKKLMDEEARIQSQIKTAKAELERKVEAQYAKLTIDQIKTLVIEKKWLAEIEKRIQTEMDNISHRLTQRIKELAERYETPLPNIKQEVDELEKRVKNHIKKMGFVW